MSGKDRSGTPIRERFGERETGAVGRMAEGMQSEVAGRRIADSLATAQVFFYLIENNLHGYSFYLFTFAGI